MATSKGCDVPTGSLRSSGVGNWSKLFRQSVSRRLYLSFAGVADAREMETETAASRFPVVAAVDPKRRPRLGSEQLVKTVPYSRP